MSKNDYHFNKTLTINYEKMRSWASAIFRGCGMNKTDADICSDHLVVADAKGIYSHGCMRVPIYCRRMEEKGTSPSGKPYIVRQEGATALVDGDNAMGQVVGKYAMDLAVGLAKKYGTGTVSVTGSNHLGACGYYSQIACKENMIGFCYTINGGNNMAPWGGCERQLGNNPFSIGVPCGKYPDVILDLATSVAARGKIVMAMKTHSPIPENWGLDINGKPTTNAEEAYWGTCRPMADYKGYGLTFLNAVISAILSNSNFGPEISDFYESPEIVQNTGHLFQAIRIDCFNEIEHFKTRMDWAIDYLKSGRRAEGVKEIFVPGEIEARKMEKAKKEGIVYPVEVIEDLKKLSEKYGILASV